jgi:Dolichyl-phosphate-mannose-protein mannosyltransferase
MLLAASFVLFSLYSIATPLFEASDELWHYPFVQYLSTGHGLPVQFSEQTDENAPWRQEGSQPPLYYALAALLTAPFDSSNWREIRRLNPQGDGGVPTRDGNANVILHTPAERFPWSGASLQAHVARLLSVILSTLTVLFAYGVGRELFPATAALRLGTAIFTAFVPMFAFISGSINNDNAAVLFCTAAIWWALRTLRLRDLSARSAVIAGLLTALGALSKSSAFGLVGLFALAALIVALRSGAAGRYDPSRVLGGRGASSLEYGRRPAPHGSGSEALSTAASGRYRDQIQPLLVYGVLFGLVVTVLSGWWFVRNLSLYGDWLGWNAFLDVVGRRLPPADLTQLWSEREGFVWAYWGVFGALNVIMPHGVYDALNIIVVLALCGWLVALFSALLGLRTVKIVRTLNAVPLWAWQLALCIFWVTLIFVSFLRWTALTPASQGRLLFPCIAVFAAAMAGGLYRLHRLAFALGSAALILLASVVPFAIITPVYAQPLALPQARPAHALNAVFGDVLELIGYDDPPATAAPGEEVDLRLYWRVRALMPVNYSVFVHLLDENDVVVAQRDMYPGQGTLAASELAVGYTWSDHYTLPIPRRQALPPMTLRWELGVYDFQNGNRLRTQVDSQTRDAIRFGRLELKPPASDALPLLRYNTGIQLLAYELQPRTLSAGSPLTVTLYWHTERKLAADYTVSVQLLDEQANKVAQHDSPPAGGVAPTSAWVPGQTITDTHVLLLANDAPPRVYSLLVIWYLPLDFSRLGAYDERGQYAGNQVELARVRVR